MPDTCGEMPQDTSKSRTLRIDFWQDMESEHSIFCCFQKKNKKNQKFDLYSTIIYIGGYKPVKKKETFMNKAKNRKILLIVLVALLSAVIACVALYLYLTPQKVTVYIFNGNYEAGTVVTNSMLAPVQIDANLVLQGQKTKADQVLITAKTKAQYIDNKRNALRVDVTEGLPLTASVLTQNVSSPIGMALEDTDKIAVTVNVNSVSGVTNSLKAGDRVNIYASGTGENGYETKLVFQNMRLLYVNGSGNSITSATVEVTTEESVKLINVSKSYSLHFALINGSNYQSVDEGLTYSEATGYYKTGTSPTSVPTKKPGESSRFDYDPDEFEKSITETIAPTDTPTPEPTATNTPVPTNTPTTAPTATNTPATTAAPTKAPEN